MFPIGIGDQYDPAQLRILAGPDASSNVVKLQRIEDLPTMVTLGNSFLHKLCSGESGNVFLPPTLKNKNKSNKAHFRDLRVLMHKILVLKEDCCIDQDLYVSAHEKCVL